jgi:hypothetical protein
LQPRTAIETTKVYYGKENAMKILLQAMANVKKEAVICSDAFVKCLVYDDLLVQV